VTIDLDTGSGLANVFTSFTGNPINDNNEDSGSSQEQAPWTAPVFSAPNYTLQLGYADNAHGCTAPAAGTTTCFPNPFDGSARTTAATVFIGHGVALSTVPSCGNNCYDAGALLIRADDISLTLDTRDSGGDDVGRVIVLNKDDDNNNGVPDLDESPVIGETNLRKLTLKWDANGAAFLKKGANGNKVRIWKDPEKNAEVLFDGTANKFQRSPVEVYVEGVRPSDATDDVELFMNFTNRDDKSATEKLTVLWVDHWEFRVRNTEAWHEDFKPATDPRDLEVDPRDKKTGLHVYNDRLGQGIELRGRVKPADFGQKLSAIHRAKQICEYLDKNNGSTFLRGNNFATNNHLSRVNDAADEDTCDKCNQLDPRASDPKGFVYDWDNSGPLNDHEKGSIDRARKNFVQWPRFGSERAGELAFWSQYISAKAAADPRQNTLAKIPLENAFQARGDNADLATGLTSAALKKNFSFNLNSASCDRVGLKITTASFPDGKVGARYDQTLQSAGGFPPIKWALDGGTTLPAGLTLDVNTGRISGTPSNAGTVNFKIKATDSQSPGGAQTDVKAFSIKIVAAALPRRSAEPSFSSSISIENSELSGLVFTLIPDLRSDDAAVQKLALSKLHELAALKPQAAYAFDLAEQTVIDALQVYLITPGPEAHALAVAEIAVLGEIGGEKSIQMLAANLTYHDPEEVYTRGPVTYTEPEPKDLPVFAALLQLGPAAVDAVFQRAVNEDEGLVQSVLADLLMHHYNLGGSLEWIDARANGTLTEQQRNRLSAVRKAVERKQ
jgi:hypothetical protein